MAGHSQSCISVLAANLRQRQGVLDADPEQRLKGSANRIRSIRQNISCEVLDIQTMPTRTLASAMLVLATDDKSSQPVADAITGEPDLLEVSLRSFARELKIPIHEQQDGPDLRFCSNCLTVISRIIGRSDERRLDLSEKHLAFAADLAAGLKIFSAIALGGVATYKETFVAARLIIESVKIFAVMANLSPEWASTICAANGPLSELGRILLHRQTLAEQANDSPSKDHAAMISGSQYSTDEDLKATTDEMVDSEELLCLVLAVLTEALLVDSQAAAAITSTALNSDCRAQKACLPHCVCDGAKPLSSHLVSIYALHSSQDHEETPASGPIASYLALLLSKLITSDAPQSGALANELPGADRSAKLQGLLASLAELSGVQSVLNKITSGVVPDDHMALDEAQADRGAEEDTVQEAIAALKELMEEQ